MPSKHTFVKNKSVTPTPNFKIDLKIFLIKILVSNNTFCIIFLCQK